MDELWMIIISLWFSCSLWIMYRKLLNLILLDVLKRVSFEIGFENCGKLVFREINWKTSFGAREILWWVNFTMCTALETFQLISQIARWKLFNLNLIASLSFFRAFPKINLKSLMPPYLQTQIYILLQMQNLWYSWSFHFYSFYSASDMLTSFDPVWAQL